MTAYRHLAVPCAAALALVATTMPAAAASNSMPGAACQALDDAPPSSLVRRALTIQNFGSFSATIVCPVEKHLSRIVSAEVMLVDRNPSTDISCTLTTFNRDGSTRSTNTRSTNTQRSNSTFTVALPITFPGQPIPTGGGYYGLRCSLPPGLASASSIVGYTVVEQ